MSWLRRETAAAIVATLALACCGAGCLCTGRAVSRPNDRSTQVRSQGPALGDWEVTADSCLGGPYGFDETKLVCNAGTVYVDVRLQARREWGDPTEILPARRAVTWSVTVRAVHLGSNPGDVTFGSCNPRVSVTAPRSCMVSFDCVAADSGRLSGTVAVTSYDCDPT
jgi:hypothetical protein